MNPLLDNPTAQPEKKSAKTTNTKKIFVHLFIVLPPFGYNRIISDTFHLKFMNDGGKFQVS